MSFDDLLKTLQEDYLNSIPSKLKTIQLQIEGALVSDLRESWHKLKGTGRTYGLPEISQLAEAVERICIVNPASAVEASRVGLIVLEAVYASRSKKTEYPLAQDGNFLKIQKLLQG